MHYTHPSVPKGRAVVPIEGEQFVATGHGGKDGAERLKFLVVGNGRDDRVCSEKIQSNLGRLVNSIRSGRKSEATKVAGLCRRQKCLHGSSPPRD